MDPVLTPRIKYVVVSERGTIIRCFINTDSGESLNDACECAKVEAQTNGEKYYVLSVVCHTIIQSPVIGWL